MRVIAGIAKGARLGHVPAGTRPVSDRAREGLFSSLGDIAGDRVLDLFAGTGALGIEALSRGAAEIVAVDRARPAVEAVRRNLTTTGLGDRARVHRSDASAFLRDRSRSVRPFDLVFIDPPYDLQGEALAGTLAALDDRWLRAEWTVVLTRATGSPTPPVPLHWVARRHLRYGDSLLIVYQEGPMGLTALCPGTFDPVTHGHLDIIGRTSSTFDQVVVGVLENPSKQPLFSVQERVELLEEACRGLENVRVTSFRGLLVNHAKEQGAGLIVKGLRAVSDYEYEIQMAQMNHRIGGIETLLMPTNPKWSFLSSSLVKEVARYGGDVSGLVPEHVQVRLPGRLEVGA